MAAIGNQQAEFKRGYPKTPIFLSWTIGDDGEDVPQINIDNADENDVAEPVFDAYGVDSVEELHESLFGEGNVSLREHQLGVMAGTGEDATFFTDEQLLTFVDGVSDAMAFGLLKSRNDLPSLCEAIRSRGWARVLDDASAEGFEWVEDAEKINDMEMRMKEADVWQEPENVSAEGW